MTEQKTTDPFEARFAGLVRTYTDEAGARPIDSLAVSRTAMASGRTTGWSTRGLGARVTGRRDGGRWAAAAVAVVLVGVVGIAVWSRSSNSGIGPGPTPSPSSAASPRASAVGPVPEALRHLWQRPLPVAPGPAWATANLILTDELLGVGSEPGTAMHSAVAAAGPDTLVVTATAETTGCAVGDVGVYRWSLEGKDTYLTLTAVGPDACAAREVALAGPWVRADLPPPSDGVTLPPGTYKTTGFDPFADDAVPGRLSYTVPAGWKVKEDVATSFVLHHVPDAAQGQAAPDTFIFAIAQPRLAGGRSRTARSAASSPRDPASGAGSTTSWPRSVARPGVVATPPTTGRRRWLRGHAHRPTGGARLDRWLHRAGRPARASSRSSSAWEASGPSVGIVHRRADAAHPGRRRRRAHDGHRRGLCRTVTAIARSTSRSRRRCRSSRAWSCTLRRRSATTRTGRRDDREPLDRSGESPLSSEAEAVRPSTRRGPAIDRRSSYAHPTRPCRHRRGGRAGAQRLQQHVGARRQRRRPEQRSRPRGSAAPAPPPAARTGDSSAPAAAAGGDPTTNACGLLTVDEIKQAVGFAVNPGVLQNSDNQSDCEWASTQDDTASVGLTVSTYRRLPVADGQRRGEQQAGVRHRRRGLQGLADLCRPECQGEGLPGRPGDRRLQGEARRRSTARTSRWRSSCCRASDRDPRRLTWRTVGSGGRP